MPETKSEPLAEGRHFASAGVHAAADRLGTEPIGRLLLRFSIPAITGMLVSALYSVVDRIFIGQAVGEMALGGLSLVMPLMTISFAFAMLFGIGAANMISMRLGQGRKQDAENALAHCFFLLFGAGILMTVLGTIFLDPILSLMGAEEGSQSLAYARSYFRVILFASVFGLLSFGLSHCTRAQGFPIITMIALLIGALLNILLDALFIMVFGWGVEGAGWATVIAQGASMAWLLRFCIGRKAGVRLNLKTFRPSFAIVAQIMSFGSAHFLFQVTMSAVQLLYNISMFRYGAELGLAEGGDIALAGKNIVVVIHMLILMPVFGINQGAQPLLGYNYGAKKFGRVLRVYRLAVVAGTAVCVAGFAAAMLFPGQLVGMFVTDGDPALMYFAPRTMRIMFLLLPFAAFTIISTTFFVVTGRPKMSIFLAMLRQCLLLVPFIFVFGRIWGLWGVIAAAPVSDALALLVTGAMIFFELRKLKSAKEQTE